MEDMKMHDVLKNWLEVGDEGHTMGRGWANFKMSQNPGSVTCWPDDLPKVSSFQPPHQ